ncbi:hypothetical protein IHE50_00740 [Candidatus Parvarchaeota archaeon]|jgi:Predicted hydrocarbon binding protein (contains V4R domain)|uniref:4-vinyl reductase 4VR domain-containing protein n=1 Tax=Candidatus Acidifodinimicrobium mancum TaxID=2898728 RepID=A0A8T3UU81_9ARCH|nr:hypothetical protein [Candidatus Acidifodinimicrobium mancum]MBE5729217.1 hypothetical protein [Candidatus Acidifodinimicrobium mancum]
MDNTDLEAEQYLQNLIMTKNVRIEGSRLLLLGRPGVMINAEFLVYFSKYLGDYNEDLVVKLGENLGDTISKDYKARFNDINKTIKFLSTITPLVGIGKTEINIEKDQIIIMISPSVLAETYVKLFGLAKTPQCHFARGILNRMLENILNEKLKVEEVECVSKGDNQCKFLMTEVK